MVKYKLQLFKINGEDLYSILNTELNCVIPTDSNNTDYQQFVNDIYTNGIGIVEGADYVGVTTYTEARAAEYPPIEDQLDKIYHDGIDAWKADIKAIHWTLSASASAKIQRNSDILYELTESGSLDFYGFNDNHQNDQDIEVVIAGGAGGTVIVETAKVSGYGSQQHQGADGSLG